MSTTNPTISGRPDRTSTYLIPSLGRALEALQPYAYPLMRFATGIMFVPHGAQKLFGWFGGNVEATIAGFSKMGFEPATFLVYLVAVVEFFGGLSIAFGFLTRFWALAGAIFLFVATFFAHWPNGFFWTKGGYEYPLLWCILCIVIFIRGPGRLAIDNALPKQL